MSYCKSLFILMLALLTLTLYFPKLSLAQQQVTREAIPQHQPKSWSTPEQEIPTVKEKKTSGWTWLILIALVGGAAAAAGGGGDDESSGSTGGGGGGDTGSYTGTW
ncbi:MAG: hypothetical protein JRF35_12815 [Deltaproteobacteria bacterium]|nr:hypothetical protein [Deltaproteobacteria bacterium]